MSPSMRTISEQQNLKLSTRGHTTTNKPFLLYLLRYLTTPLRPKLKQQTPTHTTQHALNQQSLGECNF